MWDMKIWNLIMSLSSSLKSSKFYALQLMLDSSRLICLFHESSQAYYKYKTSNVNQAWKISFKKISITRSGLAHLPRLEPLGVGCGFWFWRVEWCGTYSNKEFEWIPTPVLENPMQKVFAYFPSFIFDSSFDSSSFHH